MQLHLNDAAVPIDNNLIEGQIKLRKPGAQNWLFAGDPPAGRRNACTVAVAVAVAMMSLVQSAKLNALDPYDYLRDAPARIHTKPGR